MAPQTTPFAGLTASFHTVNKFQSMALNLPGLPLHQVSPSGSVLGPVLFLLYINDIKEHIQSTIKLFADDSILYRKISNSNDQQMI